MLIAHHLIMTAYGWWLPNDPRGSSSQEVRVEHIQGLGDLHYGRKALQPLSAELCAFYEQAQEFLKHPLLTFSDEDRAHIAAAFAETVQSRRWTCYACALMPDHVHLLIRRHRDHAEEMMLLLQDASRQRLRLRDLRSSVHPVWGGPGWKVFQQSVEQVRRTIRYIEDNPVKIRQPRQRWEFVVPYDGWTPGLR